jgi:hypothetical protein
MQKKKGNERVTTIPRVNTQFVSRTCLGLALPFFQRSRHSWHFSHPPSSTVQPLTTACCFFKSTTSTIGQATRLAQIFATGIKEGGQSDDNVRGDQQGALQIIAPPVDHQVVDNKGASEQADSLKETKIQTHIPVETPPQQHDQRRNENSNLNTASQGDTDGQIHLILRCHRHSGDVLSRITDDGQDDEADEGLADAGLLDEIIDAVDEEFGADGHQRGDDEEKQNGRGAG